MTHVIPCDAVSPSMAARLLGVSVRHVQRLADTGRLTATSTPLGRVLSRSDVERLAAERHSR